MFTKFYHLALGLFIVYFLHLWKAYTIVCVTNGGWLLSPTSGRNAAGKCKASLLLEVTFLHK